MKSFKCLCLKCTLLLLLVLRSPHVSSVCMGVTVFSSLQHPDKKKPFFFLSVHWKTVHSSSVLYS